LYQGKEEVQAEEAWNSLFFFSSVVMEFELRASYSRQALYHLNHSTNLKPGILLTRRERNCHS
jgi:hypothetical protein